MGGLFRQGDLVVVTLTKWSNEPGPRAHDIYPAPRGDQYNYEVDKYWIVQEVVSPLEVVLRTRRGKTHRVRTNDPRMRRASLWEWLFQRGRFPSLDVPVSPSSSDDSSESDNAASRPTSAKLAAS